MQHSGFFKHLFLLIGISMISLLLNAQNIELDVDEQTLKEVFIELRDQYDIQFSFNDRLVANCIVSVKGNFPSPEKAITALIEKCDLSYNLNGEVFIIYAKPKEEYTAEIKPKLNIYTGQISDINNKELLPFSNIQIGEISFIADVNGQFAYRSEDSVITIEISHLGYFLLDTILLSGSKHHLKLIPAVIGLEEVVVKSSIKPYSTHIGEKPGLIKLNPQIASFLPGNNDNTIFNLLRLQPGILAAAEQSNDYIIWGSYKGQNLINFDGIPLFSVSSLSDEIGVINPLIIKDIEVMKGGYSAQFGGRVGGVVNITGNSGNPLKLGVKLNINNQVISGLVNIPFKDKHALQLSFRQSYYNLFNWNEIKKQDKKKDLNIYDPDYLFQDVNVKFSGSTNGGDRFQISLLGNNDASNYQFSKNDNEFSSIKEIEKQQLGGSFNYNKNWKSGGSTIASVVYSSLNSNSFNQSEYIKPDTSATQSKEVYTENSISEFAVKAEHIFPSTGKHSFHMGLEYVNNTSGYREDSINFVLKNDTVSANRLGYYINDNISLFEIISIDPGIRIDFPLEISNPYIQPRIDIIIKPFKAWKINLAWGVYNQFITENAIVDDLGNYRFLWSITDNKNLSVIKGLHYITGISYSHKGLNWIVEGYYKTTNGLSRFVEKDGSKNLSISKGNGLTYGIDFYVKKEIRNHEFWVAYTLSKAEEQFSYFTTKEFQAAPQDQRHEIKGAALLNFHPWYFSANYVYGSGLNHFYDTKGMKSQPYNRADISFMYKFITKKAKIETGFSIMNVMNTKNLRYNNFSVLPGGFTVYAEATPFTPSIFLNIAF